MTGARPRAASYSPPVGRGIGCGARKRGPRGGRPPATSPNNTRPRAPPCRATIQWTGRAKASSTSPQRIDLRNAMPWTAACRTSFRISAAGRPASLTVAPRYSPLLVAIRRSSGTGRPTPSANFSAARVGLPWASKAARTGGPSPSRARSSLRSATAATATASRRGVPNSRTAPCPSRPRASPSVSDRLRSSSAGSMNEAGISSAPISRSRSSATGTVRVEGLPGIRGRLPLQDRRLLAHGPLRLQQRVAQSGPHLQVSRRAQPGVVAHPLDEGGPLGDRDGPPRVEQVEDVRALEGVVVGGQRQLQPQQPLALLLVRVEQPEQHGRIRLVQGVAAHLRLVGVEHLAVLDPLDPLDVEDALHVLQEGADPLQAVGQLGRDRAALEAAALLEVGELGDLLPVTPDLPAETPGPQRGRLPVVLDEADVVGQRVDAEGLDRVEVELLDVLGRRLEDNLELVVLEHPVGILPEPPVRRTPRGLHVGHVPGLGPERAQEGRRRHGPRPDLQV